MICCLPSKNLYRFSEYGAPGPTRTGGLRIRSLFRGVFRKLAKINNLSETLMDIGGDQEHEFVHLIHEMPFLHPIYPQITPKIFGTYSSVLKEIYFP
jgi:hypothetical protein